MRLATFPAPYPDELLYSLVSRHHVRVMGNNSPMHTFEELFGNPYALVCFDFPHRLDKLSKRLPKVLGLTSNRIISEHTLLPYYQPFLPIDRLEEIKHRMKYSEVGNVHLLTGCMSVGNPRLKFMRYCPKCLKEDRQEFGEGYWHRSHQLPGIKVCHKHQVLLENSQFDVQKRSSKRKLCALEKVVGESIPDCSHHNEISGVDMDLSKNAYWLLNNDLICLGENELSNRYADLMIEKKLATPLGRVRIDESIEYFKSMTTNEYLESLGLKHSDKNMWSWMVKLIKNTGNSSIPLRHLLVLNFLQITPEKFLGNYECKNLKPFGDGPFPCLNPVCSDFMNPCIRDVSISRDFKTGLPQGLFKCSCGFNYLRTGPDTCDADKYRKSHVENYGPKWEEELKRLHSLPEMPASEKAKSLGVSVPCFNRLVKRLITHTHLNDQDHSRKKNEEKRKKHRAVILNAIKDNPDTNRLGIKKIAKQAHDWLRVNDKEWLYRTLPEPYRAGRAQYAIKDWSKIDNELSRKVLKVINEIKCDEKNVRRLSTSRIASLAKCSTMIKNKSEKLPKTMRIIEENAETHDEYRIRKIKIAVRKLKSEGKKVSKDKIKRCASVWVNISPEVQKEIDSHCEKYE